MIGDGPPSGSLDGTSIDTVRSSSEPGCTGVMETTGAVGAVLISAVLDETGEPLSCPSKGVTRQESTAPSGCPAGTRVALVAPGIGLPPEYHW